MFVLHGLIAFMLSILSLAPFGSASVTPAFIFREMTIWDIDAVTTTIVDAFGPGPTWRYLYQFRKTFPHFHWRCIRENVQNDFLNTDTTVHYNVIVPTNAKYHEVKSVARWTLMVNHEANSSHSERRRLPAEFRPLAPGSLSPGDEQRLGAQTQNLMGGSRGRARVKEGAQNLELPCSLHLDMNIVRALHLSSQVEAAEQKYIHDMYEYQFYLGALGTHPDWDGHGFGATQVEWGIEKAKLEEERLSKLEGRRVRLPVTLLATPAGYPLYKSLGFESAANITLELLDNFEGGTAWFEYMRRFS